MVDVRQSELIQFNSEVLSGNLGLCEHVETAA